MLFRRSQRLDTGYRVSASIPWLSQVGKYSAPSEEEKSDRKDIRSVRSSAVSNTRSNDPQGNQSRNEDNEDVELP